MPKVDKQLIRELIKARLHHALADPDFSHSVLHDTVVHKELKLVIDIAVTKRVVYGIVNKVILITVAALKFEFSREAKGWQEVAAQYFHPTKIDDAIAAYIHRAESVRCDVPYSIGNTSLEAVYALQNALQKEAATVEIDDPKVKKYLKQAKESLEQATTIISGPSDDAGALQQIRQAAQQAEKAASDLNVLYGILYAKTR